MKLQRLVPFAYLFVALTQALPAPVYSSTDPDLAIRDEPDVFNFEARAVAPHIAAAAAKHKATTNLPGRQQKFQVPGGPTYTGKDVRKAVFDSHVESEANKGKSKTQLKKSPLKDFGNSDHRVPHPDTPHDTKSINNMKGPGKEFPLGDPKNKGPARVITQQTQDGHTKFKGVTAHDTSRNPGDPGYNDHFQVKPTGSKKKTGH